jgi:SDR family mycofactocin-dependent oxidoreductase
MGRLDGKVAVITGGARGQGRSHALTLAREGANIVICDLAAQMETVPYPMGTDADMAETVRMVEDLDRRCVAVKADVRDPEQMKGVAEKALAEFGKIDILLANAGIFSGVTAVEMSVQTWQEMIDVNLSGVFYSIRAVLPHMVKQGYGRIVATSSMAGRGGYPNFSHYVAAKWGVIGLVKSIALEVAAHGVTVNAVCPTTVDTTMIQNDAMYRIFRPDLENPTQEDARAAFTSLNPIPVPWVETQDISNAILFLVSDRARYITGEAISVSAGSAAQNVC